jgi:hypothetical protein
MAFLRFNRDTRGYEHFYLVHPTTNRRGKVRPRLLYWFRTPPNVKVGRQPFDEAVRRALEAQNPDIQFDWQTILDTPIPPPVEEERWRERRRFERAARQAAAEEIGEVVSSLRVASEPQDPPTESPASPLLALDLTTLNGEMAESASEGREIPPSPLDGSGEADPASPLGGSGETGPASPRDNLGEPREPDTIEDGEGRVPPLPSGGFSESEPRSPSGGFSESEPPSPLRGFGEPGPPSPPGGFAGPGSDTGASDEPRADAAQGSLEAVRRRRRRRRGRRGRPIVAGTSEQSAASAHGVEPQLDHAAPSDPEEE